MNVWEEELLKVEFVAKEGRFQSLASLPLRMDVRLIEVMNFCHSKPYIFINEYAPVFSIIASQILLVLE